VGDREWIRALAIIILEKTLKYSFPSEKFFDRFAITESNKLCSIGE